MIFTATLLSIAIAILAGLLMTRVFKPFKLPDVTAYLVAGVLIGPYFLGRLGIPGLGFNTADSISALSLISDVALGFIAFSIGNEFRLSQLKQTGKQAAIIGVVQALCATLLVDLALLFVHQLFPDKLTAPQALVLGAVATATAPAATLMVVRQYKAKGPLTSLLLPIVALDDAVGLVVFAVSFGVAKSMVVGNFDLVSILVTPLVEIVASLLLGALMGLLLTRLERHFNSNSNRLSLTILFVTLTVALAKLEIPVGGITIGFSSLLVCMMLGTIFSNICPLSAELMERADRWTAPLFTLFFVISGAQLDFTSDISIIVIGVVYIIFRSVGKYIGAYASARATHCAPSTYKYLGITLLPQAGVALGMCVTAMELGAQGALIRNIVLFSVLVYELIGPLLTKQALMKAGDIKPQSADVLNRRAEKLKSAEEKRNG